MALTKQQAQSLAEMQRNIVVGRSAANQRNGRLVKLHESGATQKELADALSTGSVAAGGEPITPDAVHKAITRHGERNR